MNLLVNLVAVLIATFAYFFALNIDICERKIQKKLSSLLLLGISIGIFLVSGIALLIVRYIGLSAAISEEIAKFLGILFLVRLPLPKLRQISKFEITKLAGGIGLGFGVLETFTYILDGAGPQIIINRLLVVIPFHIGSTMLISLGFAEKKGDLQAFLLILAAIFHIWFNSVAYNVFLQGLMSWILLSVLYFLSNKFYLKKPNSDLRPSN